MGSHTPVQDTWVLARPKVPYYGAYPAGFLHRARALLGIQLDDPLLHVCGGRVRDYPMRGLGPHDMTVDLDPKLSPNWVMDVRHELPRCPFDHQGWPAQLADQPYSTEHAKRYLDGKGPEVYPSPNKLLALMFKNARPGGRVAFLHYTWPAPPKINVPGVKSKVEGIEREINGRVVPLRIWQIAFVSVIVGYNNDVRALSVWELGLPSDQQVTPVAEPVRPGVWVIR